MASDDLRRQADSFVELQDLAPSIMRSHHPRDEVARSRTEPAEIAWQAETRDK
jgi:uracil-DNA glycosylase